MRRVNDGVHQLVHGRLDIDQVHARGGHHYVAGRHVGHPNYALEHGARLGADDFVVLGLDQGFNQLGRRVGAGVDEFCQALQKSSLVFKFCRMCGMCGVGV